MDRTLLKRLLALNEGERSHVYIDTTGHATIGIGRNLTDVGLRPNEIDYLFQNDVLEVVANLDYALPWWQTLDDVRQRALFDLCFNMGLQTLLTFKHSLQYLRKGLYDEAALALTDSLWYRQVGVRGPRIVQMIRTGSDAGWLAELGVEG